MVDRSWDEPDFAAMCQLLGFDGPVDLTKSDAVTGFDALTNSHAMHPQHPHSRSSENHVSTTSAQLSELPMPLRRCGQSDLKNIVDGLFHLPPSASLGRVPSSRLMMAWPKLAKIIFEQRSNIIDADIDLDMCDVVRDDSFTRVGKKGDSTELIPGLLGTGKWRRLKGGITMDSGCSIDTVPTGHAPNVKMDPVPPERANRRINAANGTRITESSRSGSAPVKGRSRIGRCLSLTSRRH
jgi:hypothetical protein